MTLDHCEGWLQEVKLNAGGQVIVILVGAQSDKSDKREVTKEMAEEFVQTHKLDYWVETSSKLNENVEELFLICAQMLYDKFKD